MRSASAVADGRFDEELAKRVVEVVTVVSSREQ